jgi:CTP:molybdopterin cytidylyltransferase MocA
MAVAYVLLAAGSSSRMGYEKLTAPLARRSPLERLAAVLCQRASIVVTSERLQETCAQLFAGAPIVVNKRPQDGMTSSLRAALPAAAGYDRIGVLLGDKPLISNATLEELERIAIASECDVVFPMSARGEPGHPVYLSKRAMQAAALLPNGDTLRHLRDDPSLTQRAVECADPGAFVDIDTEADWSNAERYALEES